MIGKISSFPQWFDHDSLCLEEIYASGAEIYQREQLIFL